MRIFLLGLGLVAFSAVSPAATIWVDVGNVSGVEDGSAANPFNTIQEGIDAAADGDEVVVLPGEYVETVSFIDSGITSDFTLRSMDPLDPAVVAATVINGDLDGDPSTAEGPVVTLTNVHPGFVLEGLTITGGRADFGGGILGKSSCPTIRRCVIRNNFALGNGGGVSGCGGPIVDNHILDNVADGGAGLASCSGCITGNVIEGNEATLEGGGLLYCSGIVARNTITGNRARGGGGLWRCVGVVRDNVISGNTANSGGGLSMCGSPWGTTVNNLVLNNSAQALGGGLHACYSSVGNTIVGNHAGESGGGISYCFGRMTNCIVWGNAAPSGPQVDEHTTPKYCCIQGWEGGGEGNITGDPLFTSGPLGDYYLSHAAAGQGADSPCIDAGSPEVSAYGTTRTDGVGDGGRVDIGWHERHEPAATVYADCSTSWEISDGTATFPFRWIYDALFVASEGSEVVVMPGEYRERLRFDPPGIRSHFTLRSVDPEDPEVVKSTVINGGYSGTSIPGGAVISFTGQELGSVVVSGITITGGNGPGIHGGSYFSRDDAGPLIRNCVVTGNAGGGIYACAGPIIGCTIQGNAAHSGAGLCRCLGGGIGDCVIVQNTASGSGGGLYDCSPVEDCLIAGNVAAFSGGGLYSCWEVRGCIVAGNSAGEFAGAAYSCGNNKHVAMANCTVVGNWAKASGGLLHCGQVCNSIVWGNTADSGGQVDGGIYPRYSCIQDWDAGGEGNTSGDPMFVDYDCGDYRLLPGSPCIDSANGDVAPELDMAGRPRWDHPEVPNTGIGDPPYVDMGAHESYLQTFTTPPGFLRRGWNLVSLPVDPAPPHPESVWGNQLALGNILAGNLYGYINPTGYTEYPRTLTGLERSRGYWLRLRWPTVEDVVGEAPEGPVSISLEQGWNLIGHPLLSDVLWHACTVKNGEQELHVPQAAWAGWIQEAVFGFSAGSGQYFRVPEYDAFLRPWQGYWVLAYRDDLTLIVPAP